MTFHAAVIISSLLGIIPFAYGFLHQFYKIVPLWQPEYTTFYAAIILTFVGALPWGFGLGVSKQQSATSCLYASLIAFIAWLLLIFKMSLLYFAVTFIVALIFDYIWMRRIPHLIWFLRLRLAMTSIVVVLLLLLSAY